MLGLSVLGGLWVFLLLLVGFASSEGSSGPSLRYTLWLCLGPLAVAGGAFWSARRSGARWPRSVMKALAGSLATCVVACVICGVAVWASTGFA
jgi:Kef-type K+ transport system membrane component KefB